MDRQAETPRGVTSARCRRIRQRGFRRLGIYVGLGLGALVGKPRWRTPWLELWLAAAVVAMLADVLSEALGWRPAWAPLRLATGLALSYPAGVLVVGVLRKGAEAG